MCSFIFTCKQLGDNVESVNYYSKFRGPDNTNLFQRNGFNFVHNLLSITGDFTTQPFYDDDRVCLYNGEIYNFQNFGNYKSDGECLIPLYGEFSEKFTTKLDGEFAIVFIDFKRNIAIFSSDIFKTKPMFYSEGIGNFGCATYRSCLESCGHVGVKKVPPNTTIIFDLTTMTEINRFSVFDFDLHQYKTNFDDWVLAFQESIRKRSTISDKNIFIGLSSGYDSGAIACELFNQNKKFSAYTVFGSEDSDIINSRRNIINNVCQFSDLRKMTLDHKLAKEYIRKNTETFNYTIHSSSSDYNEYNLLLIDDSGSSALSMVCAQALKDDLSNKIMISGMGADEIFSDYGYSGKKIYNHSNFGGLYPEDLSSIYPWASFFGSSMESYLAKEEYVCGSYGIESRYPFLDKAVVQEFLWLSSDLKNKYYKSVLHYYLNKNNFPFNVGDKRGF